MVHYRQTHNVKDYYSKEKLHKKLPYIYKCNPVNEIFTKVIKCPSEHDGKIDGMSKLFTH